MTKTKVVAIFVLVAGSLLYLKSVLYPPVSPWEEHHQAGLTAYRGKNYSEAEKQFKAALTEAEKLATDDWRLTQTLAISRKFIDFNPSIPRRRLTSSG